MPFHRGIIVSCAVALLMVAAFGAGTKLAATKTSTPVTIQPVSAPTPPLIQSFEIRSAGLKEVVTADHQVTIVVDQTVDLEVAIAGSADRVEFYFWNEIPFEHAPGFQSSFELIGLAHVNRPFTWTPPIPLTGMVHAVVWKGNVGHKSASARLIQPMPDTKACPDVILPPSGVSRGPWYERFDRDYLNAIEIRIGGRRWFIPKTVDASTCKDPGLRGLLQVQRP